MAEAASGAIPTEAFGKVLARRPRLLGWRSCCRVGRWVLMPSTESAHTARRARARICLRHRLKINVVRCAANLELDRLLLAKVRRLQRRVVRTVEGLPLVMGAKLERPRHQQMEAALARAFLMTFHLDLPLVQCSRGNTLVTRRICATPQRVLKLSIITTTALPSTSVLQPWRGTEMSNRSQALSPRAELPPRHIPHDSIIT